MPDKVKYYAMIASERYDRAIRPALLAVKSSTIGGIRDEALDT